jgi:hypothetical protein
MNLHKKSRRVETVSQLNKEHSKGFVIPGLTQNPLGLKDAATLDAGSRSGMMG